MIESNLKDGENMEQQLNNQLLMDGKQKKSTGQQDNFKCMRALNFIYHLLFFHSIIDYHQQRKRKLVRTILMYISSLLIRTFLQFLYLFICCQKKINEQEVKQFCKSSTKSYKSELTISVKSNPFLSCDSNDSQLKSKNEEIELDLKLYPILQNLKALRQVGDRRYVPQPELKNFVGQKVKIQDYINTFQGKEKSKINQILRKFQDVKWFRRVRGDGNCFYTAFGCSLLEWCLRNLKHQTIIKLIKLTEIQQIVDETNEVHFSQNDNKEQLKQYLIDIIQNIQMRDPNGVSAGGWVEYLLKHKFEGLFYEAYSTFIRSYIYSLIEKVESEGGNEFIFLIQKQDILFWEKELENNEIICQILSQHLNLFLCVYTFDAKYEYNVNNTTDKFCIFFNPGHYGIVYEY